VRCTPCHFIILICTLAHSVVVDLPFQYHHSANNLPVAWAFQRLAFWRCLGSTMLAASLSLARRRCHLHLPRHWAGRVSFGATGSRRFWRHLVGRVSFDATGSRLFCGLFCATGSRLFRRHCTGSRLFRRHWVAWSRSSPPSLTLVQGVASLWSMESKIKHNKYNIYNAHSYYYYCFAFYLSRLGPRGFLLGSFCLNIR
jgi:hypothetical protein